MESYKNIFYPENSQSLLSVELDYDDIIVEDSTQTENSQAIELDIKNGYVDEVSYFSGALVENRMLFELHVGSSFNLDDLAERVANFNRDSGYSIQVAFTQLFNSYIMSCNVDSGLSSRHGKARFWYEVSTGTIKTLKHSSNYGLRIRHGLVNRSGHLVSSHKINGYDILPNLYGGGDTCHGGKSEVSVWRDRMGKTSTEPDTLAKSYEVFKGGVGNHDLSSHNRSRDISSTELLRILEEFKTNYVELIEHRYMKRSLLQFVTDFMEALSGRFSTESTRLNLAQLVAILEKTPSFYIEDFIVDA